MPVDLASNPPSVLLDSQSPGGKSPEKTGRSGAEEDGGQKGPTTKEEFYAKEDTTQDDAKLASSNQENAKFTSSISEKVT